MTAMFVVHSSPVSPYGRAVMATLEEKGASWRMAPLKPGMVRQPGHLARQPFGRMPVLEHGGFSLYETQAILRYLDRILPEPPLTPAGLQATARMDQVIGITDCYLVPGCARVIGFERVAGPVLLGTTPNLAAIEAAMPQARLAFGELSRLLGDAAWMAGDAFSLADLILAPQLDLLSRAPEWRELTEGRANLADWLARSAARPSLLATTWECVSAGPGGMTAVLSAAGQGRSTARTGAQPWAFLLAAALA